MRSRDAAGADAAASRSAASVAGDVADQLEVGLAGRGQLVRRHVERDELRLLAEAAAEAEAEVERDADDQRDVGLLQALAAGAARSRARGRRAGSRGPCR